MFRRITHVIYDVDGLLLDTEPFYTQVNRTIAERYGRTYDWSLKTLTLGRRAADTARIMVETVPLPMTPEQYLEERKVLIEELFPLSQPMPGAVRLTRHLHRHGIPQAIASSSELHHFDLKTSRHQDWFSIFECRVIGADPEVRHGKPAPDIYLAAARRMGADPANCLAFEDAPSGVEAAAAAGMAAIAVPDPNIADLPFPGARQVLKSLTEFNPLEWGLPGY